MAYILYFSFHTSILYGDMSSSVADGLMIVFCKTQKPAWGAFLLDDSSQFEGPRKPFPTTPLWVMV